jgi:regulator of protease activity HflC (stomatin/prohibitin superfamily)
VTTTLTAVVIVVIVVAVVLGLAVRIVKQYERGVLFRFGRMVGPAGPACG